MVGELSMLKSQVKECTHHEKPGKFVASETEQTSMSISLMLEFEKCFLSLMENFRVAKETHWFPKLQAYQLKNANCFILLMVSTLKGAISTLPFVLSE